MEPFSPIDQIIEDIAAGKMVVLVDDEHRENEGDLVCAAEKVTPQIINFMLQRGRGMLCVALESSICDRLNLHAQTLDNTAQWGTAFTVTVDAGPQFGVSTGVSASDRATTIQRLVAEDARAGDFSRPGHISPLRARDGGVLVRAGQTEGSVDLARLAGLKPGAAIIEVMNDDGTMARVPQLIEFCRQHGLRMCTVADLIQYRMQREQLVHRVQTVNLPTDYGEFKLIAYRSLVDRRTQLALVKGDVGKLDADGRAIEVDHPVLVRVHSECMTGDVFGSQRCECGKQLQAAMRMIDQSGEGAVVYLRQEGRGIGLANKLHAYALQERGLDTVQANLHLGFADDRRDYGLGAQILRDLGLRHVKILTNNPKKTGRLEVYGLRVVEQVPLRFEPGVYNRRYLKAKEEKLGHKLG